MYLKSLLPWMYKNPQNTGYCITLEEILCQSDHQISNNLLVMYPESKFDLSTGLN